MALGRGESEKALNILRGEKTMKLSDVLMQPALREVLDVLRHESSTAAQIALKLGVSEEVASGYLTTLSESGAAIAEDNLYTLCCEAFYLEAQQLMRYSENEVSSAADKSLCEHMCLQREESFHHAPFDREVAFYESICSGNIETVKMLSTPLCSKGYGILSHNPLRNLKYHFTISVAMIARFCINGGMTPEDAYSLSDVFIQRADECTSEEGIHMIHSDMIVAFTKRMRRMKTDKIYSKPIVRTIDYISEHLHQRIMMQELANYLSLSVAYLSRLFKLETGVTLSEYINMKKVEAASNMLQYSEYSDLQISTLLSFSSQSYFIKVFRKYTGMTPKEYKKCYRFPEWKTR